LVNLGSGVGKANNIMGTNAQRVPGRPLRIALYSHDTMGLGHVRRNVLIAWAIANSKIKADFLLLTGIAESSRFAVPRNAERVILPPLCKGGDGHYRSRLSKLTVDEVRIRRTRMMRAALAVFDPDLFIVDKHPRGALNELDTILPFLTRERNAACVLGVRDVLDDPETAKREWRASNNNKTIRDYYDQVWIYGDPRVSDVVRECALPPDVADRVRHLGYFDHRLRDEIEGSNPAAEDAAGGRSHPGPIGEGPMALCLVGGGEDGVSLADAFVRTRLPDGLHGVLVTGPFMPPEDQRRIHRIAAERQNVQVFNFHVEPRELLPRAARVIAMGGYNTTYEVLSYGCPLLIVPRVRPRLEQLVRAQRLAEFGLAEVLHPNDLAPAVLEAWLTEDRTPPSEVRRRLDFGAIQRLPEAAADLIAWRAQSSRGQARREGA
jgi:predicted glycosyltransferase